jgi:tripartite-type tricarboxylate transporter receptor subunit TctC
VVTVIVPQPAGGGNDAIARVFGQECSKVIGQGVVIDNRPGAGGNIGTAFAARAPTDVHEKLAVQGAEVWTTAPEQFANLIKAELPKWQKIVKDSGATVD